MGIAPPINRYLLGDDLRMAENRRLSAGIDQQITKTWRVGVSYADVHARGILVGQNLNAPVGGVRPDPAFANIVETVAEGRSRTRSLSANIMLSLSPQRPGGTTAGPRFSWKRGLSIYGYYSLSRSENDTEGAFSIPASNTLSTEWGPSSGDVRHRVMLSVSTGALKHLNASINMSASSATPYTIRTGRDDNGDLVFNDRPEGVSRNTERAKGQWYLSGYFGYTLGFGKRKTPLSGLSISGSSLGQFTVSSVNMPDAPRYSVTIMLNVNNLTNHANYYGYSGVMTSPFFGRPTTVQGVRQVRLQTSFSF